MTKQTTAAERRETFTKGLKLITLPLKTSPDRQLEASIVTLTRTLAEKKLEKEQRTPVQDRVQLKCQWEPPSSVAKEVMSLSERWAAELGHKKFDPDWDRIFWLERMNSINIWTARTPTGALAGYLVVTILKNLFTSERYSRIEAGYLAPEWREGLRGFRYIKSLVTQIKGSNIEWETNDLFEPDERGRARLAKLLERLGFKQVGTVMRTGL